MARAFTTNQQISGTTTATKNLTNFSMAGWIRRPSSASRQCFGCTESTAHWLASYHFTDNVMYFLCGNGSNTFATSTQNITGWNHWAFTFDSSQTGNANRLRGYLNGVALTLGFSGTIPATTSNNVLAETIRIGRITYDNSWSTGDFAEFGMWQATLTAAEVASLGKGMPCSEVRPQSLVFHVPLVREIQELRRAMALTNTASTVATHPRIYQ
jgi:hypothetical protein